MENNSATATNSTSPTTTPEEQQPYTAFDAGDTVILHSLIQSTHVNGRRGIIHSYPKVTLADIQNPLVNDPNPNEPRCMVRLLPETTSSSSSNANNSSTNSNANPSAADPYTLPETTTPFNIAQQCISIKTKNMTLDYKSGSEVKLFGLVGAKHYNERVAKIASYRYVLSFVLVYITVVMFVYIIELGFVWQRICATNHMREYCAFWYIERISM